MDITEFLSSYSGGARPNRYQVILSFPFEAGGSSVISALSAPASSGTLNVSAGVSTGSPSQLFSFMCRSTELPDSNVNQVQVPYLGRMLQFAGDRTFSDWNVMVYNDENFSLKSAFERWLNNINSHQGNIRSTPTNAYFADAIVNQLSVTGETLKSYTMKSIFPTNMGPIQLGFDMNDTVEEFSINFAVNWWESDTTT